ncbi:MAG: non-homologous end joining protein Ku [Solirubrobacteraceae bacterium]
MPRPLWSGSLSFGLVNVPVTLQSAVRDRSIRFHLLHEPDLSPVRTRRVCAAEGVEVPSEEILKGYELADGTLVLLTDEELEAAAPRKSKTIDIERFVDETEVDPLYYERPYLLAPREEGAVRAYLLLSQTMRASERVALGRFVMRARERLVAIRSHGDGLALCTMRFADELRGIEELAPQDGAKRPGRQAIDRAVALIEELSVDFEPGQYRDEHRAHLQRIVERKRRGEEIAQPREEAQPPTVAPDLMGALEESLARIRDQDGGGRDGSKRSARGKAPAKRSRSSTPG